MSARSAFTRASILIGAVCVILSQCGCSLTAGVMVGPAEIGPIKVGQTGVSVAVGIGTTGERASVGPHGLQTVSERTPRIAGIIQAVPAGTLRGALALSRDAFSGGWAGVPDVLRR